MNFYSRKEIKDLLAYLKLIYNTKDDISLLRVINYPKRGIGLKAIENLTIKANIVASQVDVHRLYGGVVPEIASRRHAEAISGVVSKALEDASLELKDVDAVAVTYAPGLIGALLTGLSFAKGLS